MKVRCPNCWKKTELAIDELPAEMPCPECEALLKIDVAYVPQRPKPSAKHIPNFAAAA